MKIKQCSLSLLAMLLLFGMSGYAQDRLPHDNLETNFSASPNAGGISNGQTISVDPYTGTLQAGISLYSYQNKSTGLRHSVSISYQGGGIRVDDISSNCGLGWSLAAAGTVTKVIKGIPDEDEWGFLSTPSQIMPGFDSTRWRRIVENNEDGEQDFYMFNTGTTGGKFMIGKNGQIATIPRSNVKIEFVSQTYTLSSAPLDSCISPMIKITTDDGTQYYYGKFDCSRFDYPDQTLVHAPYASSVWYLTSIVSAFNQDTIFFDYTPHVLEYDGNFSFVRYTSNYGSVQNPDLQYYNRKSTIRDRMREQRLAAIRYPDGTTLSINYDNFNRLDLHSDNAISNITISNSLTGSSYGYRFGYSYRLGGGTLPPIAYQDYSGTTQWNNSENGFRLQLDSLYRFSGAEKLPGYRFVYNSKNLPSRGVAASVDHWGYFSSSAGDRIPAYNSSVYPDLPGGSREPNEDDAQASALQQVVLPTGGTVNWEYELHQVPGTPVTGIHNYYSKDSLYQQTNEEGWYNDDTATGSFPMVTAPAAIPSASVIHRLVVTPTTWPTGVSGGYTIKLKIWKRRSYNNAAVFAIANLTFDSIAFANHTPQTIELTRSKTDTISWGAIASSLITQYLTNNLFNIQWSVYSTKLDSSVSVTTYPVAKKGGLRVKRMIQDDGTGQSNDLVTDYRYVEENGASSGTTRGEPDYDFDFSETYTPVSSTHPDHIYDPAPGSTYDTYDLVGHLVNSSATANQTYGYLVRTGAAQNALVYTHGSPVGYRRVEMYSGTADNYKAKTVYEFTTMFDYTSLLNTFIFNNFPYPTPPDIDFLTGLPLTIKQYNAANKLVKKQTNEYAIYTQLLNDSNFTSVKLGLKRQPPTDEFAYGKKDYYPVTAKIFPTKGTQVEYFAGGDSVVTTQETIFDTAYMVPKYVKSLNAKNEQVVTRYYYPYEFNISGPITTLQNMGIIYAPVRTEVWKYSSKVLNAAVSTFQTLPGNVIKQQSSYGLTTASPITAASWGSFNNTQLIPSGQSFTEIATMDKYDDRGNLIQTTSKGQTGCIIWDYKHHLPVAKVENAAAADVAFTSFEGDGTGGWTAAGTMALNNTDALTGKLCAAINNTNSLNLNNLTPAQTYILTCWCKQGTPSGTFANGGPSSNITFTPSDSHKGWTLYRAVITGARSVKVTAGKGGSYYLDELRLYPQGAAMTTYTYDALYGATSTTDISNRTVYYEYDRFGRLKYQRDLDGHIIKTYDYKNQEQF